MYNLADASNIISVFDTDLHDRRGGDKKACSPEKIIGVRGSGQPINFRPTIKRPCSGTRVYINMNILHFAVYKPCRIIITK